MQNGLVDLETFCQKQENYRTGMQQSEKWILQMLGIVSQNSPNASTYETALEQNGTLKVCFKPAL